MWIIQDRWMCYKLNNDIQLFAEAFANKYFCDESGMFDWEIWFVEDSHADELNYNLYVNDCYFSLQDIFYALWYNIPYDMLMEWYDYNSDPNKKERINLKNWYLSKLDK